MVAQFLTVLQKDIEAHGRIVSSVVKLGERVAKQQGVKEQKQHQEQNFECQQDQSGENFQHPNRQLQSIRIANSLERRWHLLFLRALEWQCHIETLATRVYNKGYDITDLGQPSFVSACRNGNKKRKHGIHWQRD
ncbi:hypothetical protein PV326_002028 [Microctonus aethiopoides]|nr:hypothetical protein PV326_002028 [Microctonus aethiopoides]